MQYSISGALRVKLVQDRNKLIIRPNGWEYDTYRNAGVCYIDANGEQKIIAQTEYDAQQNCIVVTPTPIPQVEKLVRLKWKVCLYYEEAGEICYKRFVNRAVMRRLQAVVSDAQSQAFRYGSCIYEFEKRGKIFCAIPYFTNKGRMGIVIRQKARSLLPLVKAKIEKCHIDGSQLRVRISVKADGYVPGAAVLQFRTEKRNKECKYIMDTTSEIQVNGAYRVIGEIDLKGLQLRPVYWDLRLTMYKESEMDKPESERFAYYVNAYNMRTAFKEQFLRLRQEVAYRTEDGNIFFPYMTRNDTIAFKYREVSPADSVWFRIKERIARKIYKAKPEYWDGKHIYLVYEKYCMGAQDNGYHFFRYCMKHKKQAEKQADFYYVIDKKSPDYGKVRKYGHRVVPFLSIRHMVYIQAAQLLISTDSKPHAYAWRQKGSVLYDEVMAKKSVFLQHGVTGFKNVNKLYMKKPERGSDLFIATSQQEKAIIHQKLKYPNKDIAVTGFARWDVLSDKSGDSREILVMPTWRNWLDSISDEEFCKSNYFKHYEELLESERLKALLEQEDLHLTFYLHPIMRNFIHVFQGGSSRIRLIAFGEQPLNEIMMRSKLMITDYSSASWDMFYMKKPVIFYQFDAKDYLDIHGSYLNFEQELFGERAVQLDELLDCITKVVDSDFKLDEQYYEKYERAFPHVDDHNSERILKAIQKMMRASDE